MDTFEDVSDWLNPNSSSQKELEGNSTFNSLITDDPNYSEQSGHFILSNQDNNSGSRCLIVTNSLAESAKTPQWNSEPLTVNTSEIEYHPILLPTKPEAPRTSSWPPSRRLSHETSLSSSGDSGFFNVPTPPGSFSSSSQEASPYSSAVSLASPQSNFTDLYSNLGYVNYDDLELEKIVDDVDNMYREQLRKKAEEDLSENINVIRRNLPAKKDGISSYLSQTTQEIADQIARNLVDRALELDRKRLVKKITKKSTDEKLHLEETEVLNNFTEVAVNRVTEIIAADLINDASKDMSNIIKHKCNGNLSHLNLIDVSQENTKTLLNYELSKLVNEFVSELPQQPPEKFKLEIPTNKGKRKKLSPAMQRRETMRRARTKNGILVSSLKKKIYHCNCVDCQAKRVAEGKPAYLEPIFVQEMDLGDLPDSIPIAKKRSRGRPRKYPRLDDVMRYKSSLVDEDTERAPEKMSKLRLLLDKALMKKGGQSNNEVPEIKAENEVDNDKLSSEHQRNFSSVSEELLQQPAAALLPRNCFAIPQEDERSSNEVPREEVVEKKKRPALPKSRRPAPLSVKKKWISLQQRKRTKALVRLRPCHVPLESERTICQAFIAQFKRIQQEEQKPSPNPLFILRHPLRMLK